MSGENDVSIGAGPSADDLATDGGNPDGADGRARDVGEAPNTQDAGGEPNVQAGQTGQHQRGAQGRVQGQQTPRSVDRRDATLQVDESIVMTTTDTVPGEEIDDILGVVRGNSVRAKNVGRDITQGIRNLFGGELPQYGQLLADTRDQAEYRLRAAATDLDADAVVTMRIETSEIGGAAAEIHAYGTAVSLK